MRHPEIRDVCDLGQMIFYNQRWAFWFTAVMFILNNTFIQVRTPCRACARQWLTVYRDSTASWVPNTSTR
jgi:hypothetical protein